MARLRPSVSGSGNAPPDTRVLSYDSPHGAERRPVRGFLKRSGRVVLRGIDLVASKHSADRIIAQRANDCHGRTAWRRPGGRTRAYGAISVLDRR